MLEERKQRRRRQEGRHGCWSHRVDGLKRSPVLGSQLVKDEVLRLRSWLRGSCGSGVRIQEAEALKQEATL
jgi:hypothetical protein